MIRKYDRVRVLPPSVESISRGALRDGDVFPVISLTAEVAHIQVAGPTFVFPIADLELVCHRVGCGNVAARFVRTSLAAVCQECADARYHTHELVDTRGDESAIVACVCGESLDNAKSKGAWTLGEVVCEYRDCSHCGSTRAYMPAPIVAGFPVVLYRDPSTSEVSDEQDNLLDALEAEPTPGAELRRRGLVLASVVEGPGGRAWLVAKPQRERPRSV